jgi:hypothetical protein
VVDVVGKVVCVLAVFDVLRVVWLSDVETVVDVPVVSILAYDMSVKSVVQVKAKTRTERMATNM